MKITSLDEMEAIVKKNRELRWDGWTVVSSYPSDKARTSKYGALVNGVWHIQNRFVPSETGWDIPNKFMR
jgi:hypothetical protein